MPVGDTREASGWTVRKLRPAEIAPTARLLARAFADNPAYAFMHPRARTRARDLVRFFERNLAWHAPLDLTWVAADGADRVVGTATLEPPGGVPHGGAQLLRHWVLPTLFEQGVRTLSRILRADQQFARINRATAEGRAFWHLHAVAIDPDHQGRGAGKALLRSVLGELDALLRARPAPVILSTQREQNVRLYEGFGFAVRDCSQLGGRGEDSFRSWSMRRP